MKKKWSNQLLTLFVAGVFIEAIFFLFFFRLFPIVSNYELPYDIGYLTNYSIAFFWTFLGVLSFLFILFIFSLLMVRISNDRRILWLIFGFGFLFTFTLSFVSPLTSVGVYTYIAQSRLWTIYHSNPIFITPLFFQNDVIALLGTWHVPGTPFGPLGIIISSIPTIFLPNNLLANLVFLKLQFSVLMLITAFFVYKIMMEIKPEKAAAAALFITWNPFILFETSLNGHNDIAMMVFAVMALFALLKGHFRTATVLLVLSILTKYATLVLLPLFIAYSLYHLKSLKNKFHYILSVITISSFFIFVSYYPFWLGAKTFDQVLLANNYNFQTFRSILIYLFPQFFTNQTAMIASLIIFLPLYITAVFLARKNKEYLLRSCFWVLFCFLIFGLSTFNIWYAIWPLIFAGASPRNPEKITAIIFSYFAIISVTNFSFIYQWLDRTTPTIFGIFNILTFFEIFLPPVIFIVCYILIFKRKKIFNWRKNGLWNLLKK